MNHALTILVLLAAIVLGGCAESRSDFGVISGSVTYDRLGALPPDAELEVGLYDLSRGGADGTLVARHRAKASPEQAPAPFAMRYAAGAIDPTHSYAVRAQLAAEDEPLLETRAPYPVLTQGHPRRVELVLEPTGRTATEPPARPEAPVNLIPATTERSAD